MKFYYYIILVLPLILHVSVSISTKQTPPHLTSCLKLKSKAPYLNLNCDKLIETTNKDNLIQKTTSIKNESEINFVSIHELKANVKSINETEKEKLFQMINHLKTKNEESSLLAR
jgi:hypothetical protein